MNPSVTNKGENAKQRLIAAAFAQFGEYGLNATTRDIVALAGQNIAAINYYFGSKEDLYFACAHWVTQFIEDNFRPWHEAGEQLLSQPAPDRNAVHQLLLAAGRNLLMLLTQDETVNLSKFISREQLSPTAAGLVIHHQVIAPLHDLFTRLIAAYTGRDASDTQTILHTHALLGEILSFRIGRETILLRTGWQQFDENNVEQINQVVTFHIDLLLQGLTQRS